ncbi:MAG: 3-oxoacyl-[acyl-carrier-protein] reductase [Candidatus Melainabacteria bacterium]|jgi:3-oxoacyl-[acyl-carrier protein] reductase|uniref:3-oxoacyl-[acyl-carrier-protein] reductase n=1 Tax=Candidatus Obscuribacter phosphatis TaxID=1906157 RepID=A0A8J7P7R3_9BACT|nr:3-oxoacyl-[acyl-carrier-protein] reductase [Candidatus Obscuribacter phosphatis]MBX9940457.1 3-oxoacyl-[acyl-carrier-protein] reductase [Candidatus Obscuribacterales bacterium]MCA0312565.1 3-oxoacyl-[acyl-carrier-protein] reductase [Candidatus Melainabacteria bacterium]
MTTSASLANQVAVVTGSGRGIGRAIAEALMKEGARVVISDINEELCSKTAQELAAQGGETLSAPCNVTQSESVAKMVETVMAKWGRIDILVNNAGITRDNLFMRMSEGEWQAVIDTNLTSAFKVTQPVLKIMSKQRSGRIINIASTTGVHGNFGQVNYAAAKAGMIGFTKTVALEYASRNITANVVAPGFIDTDMTRALGEEIINKYVERIPLKRMGTPDDIARAVCFFAGPGAYVTGQVMEVNGGLYT